MQVKDKRNVEPIFTDLLHIMRFTAADATKTDACRIAKECRDAFAERWKSEDAFVSYFLKEWGEKLGMCLILEY